MGKLTWQQLGLLFGGSQFNLTPEEAAKLLADAVFTKNWKTKRMWEDQEIVASWTRVLYEHDKLAKKYWKTQSSISLV